VKVEERSYLEEVGDSGVTFFFSPPPPNLHTYWFPGQTPVPFPPLRELICSL